MNSESIFTEAIVCDSRRNQNPKMKKGGLLETKMDVRLQKAGSIYLRCLDGRVSGIVDF